EVALAADQPVAGEPVDPVLVAHPHVWGMPGQLPTAPNERVAQVRVGPAVLEVPLSGGDDLKRLVAFLVELHCMGDRPRSTVEIAGLSQHFDDPLAGSRRGEAGEVLVRRPRAGA